MAALGAETPGVPRGPLHRPGQPCIVCHDGEPGDAKAFSMAGTVFLDANSLTPAAVGATVTFSNADGTTVSTPTNAAGNFFLTPDVYAPGYPVHVTVTLGGSSIKMQSHIGTNGSCAGCHADPAGPNSPGHVYFIVTGPTP